MEPKEMEPMSDEQADRLRQIVEARVVYEVPGMDVVEARRDIPYKTADGKALEMDVYQPAGLAQGERRPGVIFVHGGPLPPGDLPEQVLQPKNWGTFVSYGELVAASGLVGVTFNHRYRSLEALDVSVGDVASAIGYVREHGAELHLDSDRLALWVFSGAGPHLSLPLRERPAYVLCLVSFYSLLDFPPFTAMGLGTAPPGIVEQYSPRALLDDGDGVPPILLARAGRDHPATNQSISDFLQAALEHGVAVDFTNHPTGIHGFDIMNDDERSREIVARALEFLAVHLGTADRAAK
jgi:acetyl esterase/lipase